MVIIISAITLSFSISTKAANPDFAGTTNISLETAVSGQITEGYNTQQLAYRFTLTNAGGVTIKYSHPAQSNGDIYWLVDVYNSSYELITEEEITGNSTSTTLPLIGLNKGKYYVVVKSPDANTAKSSDTYNLTIHFEGNKKNEMEKNETFTTATKITENEVYYGSTTSGYNKEKDYYRVKTGAQGVLKVKFSHSKMSTANSYWNVTVYDGSYRQLCKRPIYGQTTSYTFPGLGIPAGTYYILVESTDANVAQSKTTYSITAKHEQSTQWEKELNDSFTSATNIALDTDYYGTSRDGYNNEKDFYKFSIKYKGKYAVTMTTSKQADATDYWEMVLYDSSYNKVSSTNVKGSTTSTKITSSLLKGTYYVSIASTTPDSVKSESKYKLAVKTKSITLNESNVDITLAQTTYVYDGKEKTPAVYVNGKGFAFTPSDYKITYTGNINVGTATVKVKFTGKYSGTFTKKFTINPKGTTLKKIRGGKKKINITWKARKIQITGYQIKYSTKKTFKKAKSVKVKKGITKTTVSKLKAKKKYYVKIRTYTVVENQMYYSKWSKVKTANTK